MKTLLSDNINHKFINNLPLSGIDNLNVIISSINTNIYELYYRYNFNYLLLDSQNISNAILQFIVEYGNKLKCYMLFRSENNIESFNNDYGSVCKILCDYSLKHKNIGTILPQRFINTRLYNPYVSYPKENIISCFLDNIDNIPQELTDVLYPKTQLKIRLFNGQKFAHIQNLGVVDEIEKAKILSYSEYYLDLNNLYSYEAQVSHCKILDTSSLESLVSNKDIIDDNGVIDYEQIIKEIIL